MRFRPHFFSFLPSPRPRLISLAYYVAESREPREGLRSEAQPRPSGQPRAKMFGLVWQGVAEILGCGMIHPNVFANVGYPKDKYSGFAFGMGIERIAMLKYGINDIRLFYEDDLRFLRQF